MVLSTGEGTLEATKHTLGSLPISSNVDRIKGVPVLEVAIHSKGGGIPGSEGAVGYWTRLMKDDSRPVEVIGLGDMCVL